MVKLASCAAPRCKKAVALQLSIKEALLNQRAGDWCCYRCLTINVGSRLACYKCGEDNHDQRTSADLEEQISSADREQQFWEDKRMRSSPDEVTGDQGGDGEWQWSCGQCNAMNQAWRKACLECGAEAPADDQPEGERISGKTDSDNTDNQAGLRGGGRGGQEGEGDVSCVYANYANRLASSRGGGYAGQQRDRNWYPGRGRGYLQRQNDWPCWSCLAMNRAWRYTCFRCGEANQDSNAK